MKIRIIRAFFSLAACMAGFALFIRFPDLDIKILGIGYHRYFLFHSAILPVIGFFFLQKVKSSSSLKSVLTGFFCGMSLSIGFHLALDVFQTAAVKFPLIGSLVDGTSVDDRLWEGTNALVSISLGYYFARNLYTGVKVK